ncbi:pLS20_p028 family conjugation system transmembrane protein [Clostridium perfringens]|uniref:pLS20_p028 family conjugation system transmembrane protein n=1 Tax=Clostridium perfringens TaxID=1502 RepID=UPI0037549011
MSLLELTNLGILTITGIINHCFRWLGWGLIKVLASVVNGIEEAVNKIYTLNSFFQSDEINSLIDRYKPIMWAIFAISILILGYKIMLNKKRDRQSIPTNILFSLIVVMALPMMMVQMSKITDMVVRDSKSEYTSSANLLVKDALYDLYALDQNDFDFSNKNNIPDSNIFNIDINEEFDVDSDTKHEDIFKNKIEMLPSGKTKEVKLEKNWIAMDENYYRYNIDFIPVIISLLTTGITLLCVGFKVAKLIYELAFKKIFAIIFAFADIEDDNKRLKAILKDILASFLIIMLTAILLKLYVLFNAWLSTVVTSTDIGIGFTSGTLAKLIFQISVSFAVIDAPNLVERILGIDAGLKSGFNTMMGAYAGAKSMLGAGKSVVKMAGAGMKGLDKTIQGGVGLAGGVAGVFGGAGSNKTLSQEQQEVRNQQNNNSNGTTLQEEMKKAKGENIENSQNENSNKNLAEEQANLKTNQENNGTSTDTNKTLSEEMKDVKGQAGETNKPSETLQEEMNKVNGNSGINNKGESLQEEMKKNNPMAQSLNGNNQNESLQSEMNRANGNMDKDISDLKNPNANLGNSTLQDEMKGNKENIPNMNNNINNNLGVNQPENIENQGKSILRDNPITRKVNQYGDTYRLGKSATQRYNIPRRFTEKKNYKKGEKE